MSGLFSPLAALLGALLFVSPCLAADGDLDPGFGQDGIALLTLDGVEGHELRAGTALTLPDGKLLFGGSRNLRFGGNPDPAMRATLMRMNADGTADTDFGGDPANPGILVLPEITPTGMQLIEGMLRLDDGSIVVAGSTFAFGPVTGFVAKLDADGSPDPSFGVDGYRLLPGSYVHALARDSQGRLLVAGEHVEAGRYRGAVSRLLSDGSLDPSYGSAGSVLLEPVNEDDGSSLNALVLDASDRAIVGGVYEDSANFSSEFSLARLDADGQLDASFADAGWRIFRKPGDASLVNGIERIALDAEGRILLGAHHDDGSGDIALLLVRLDANGADDPSFGSSGYFSPAGLPPAWSHYASALQLLDDGKLLVAVSWGGGGTHENYLLLRVLPEGNLDTDFAEQGIFQFDLAPDGLWSDLTALTLQDGQPILVGSTKRDPNSFFVDLGVLRLGSAPPADDTIFANGFEQGPLLSNFDDLAEGYLGTEFHYQGIHWRECNGIAGVFPDGTTFDADYPGDLFIIEDASDLYLDFPNYGSPPNVLTFGNTFMPGPNLSLGGFVRATLDLDAPARELSFEAAYYENGPWGGIEFHLDAYQGASVVASRSWTISDLGGRDNVTVERFSVAAASFDSVKLYATWNGQPTAPRLLIDDLELTPVD